MKYTNREIQTYKINHIRKSMEYTKREIQTDKMIHTRKTMQYTNHIRTTVKYKPKRITDKKNHAIYKPTR